MKHIQLLFSFSVLFCLCSTGLKAQTIKTEKTTLNQSEFVTAEFTITGMACQEGCADAIQKNIEGLQGVKKAEISYEKGFGTVLFNNTSATIEDITLVIKNTKVKDYVYSVETTTIIKN